MFNVGNIVTLATRKVHGYNPETQVILNSGICGMIVNIRSGGNGTHNYVVDFGPEGQWNCTQNELSGDDQDSGWETDLTPQDRIAPDSPNDSINPFAEGLQGLVREIDTIRNPDDLRAELKNKSDNFNVNVDIEKRMKEIERGVK